MDKAFLFIFGAVCIEGIIYYVKESKGGQFSKSCIASIILGVFVAVNFNLDVFEYFGMYSLIPHAGSALSGVLLSRGSNYLFNMLGNYRKYN